MSRTVVTFILTLVGGAWVTSTAMLGERRPWVRPILLAVGLAITVIALAGIVLSRAP